MRTLRIPPFLERRRASYWRKTFSTPQATKDVIDRLRVCLKFGDVAGRHTLPPRTRGVEFGLIGPENYTIRPHRVYDNARPRRNHGGTLRSLEGVPGLLSLIDFNVNGIHRLQKSRGTAARCSAPTIGSIFPMPGCCALTAASMPPRFTSWLMLNRAPVRPLLRWPPA
jgi:hypothetical protein